MRLQAAFDIQAAFGKAEDDRSPGAGRQAVDALALAAGGRRERPAMRFERALHPGRGRRCNALEHPLRRLRPRRRSAGREQRDPALAHHELLPAVLAFERDRIAARLPAEAPPHDARRAVAVEVQRAEFVAFVAVQREPRPDAGAIGAGQDTLVAAGPVEAVAAAVGGVGAGRRAISGLARHAGRQARPAPARARVCRQCKVLMTLSGDVHRGWRGRVGRFNEERAT